MPTPLDFRLRLHDPANLFWPVMNLYSDHFARGRYNDLHSRRCTASVLHFGDWLRAEGVGLDRIDAACIDRFLLQHLPACNCRKPVPANLILNRAALNTLLRVLRQHGLVASPVPDDIDAEIGRFRASSSTICVSSVRSVPVRSRPTAMPSGCCSPSRNGRSARLRPNSPWRI